MTALDVMRREAEKEPRGVNHVIPLDVGSYTVQGLPAAVNRHIVCVMTWGPIQYYFIQQGF
jgi:hypothetical protein